MKTSISRRTTQIHMPPIHSIMGKVRTLKNNNETIYSMAQAVPWYSPPRQVIEELNKEIYNKNFHFYSPDPGLLSSRQALASDFASRRKISINPRSELHLTCGASQAFVTALMATADPGDRVIVLEPYYFDHVFAIQFSNLVLDSIPMEETNEWKVPWKQLEKKIEGAKVLVLVNPGNPTGSALTESEIRRIVKLTKENNCTLIIDETYERFNFAGSSFHSWQETKEEHVLTLGSFSKSFSLSGWRLGYLFGADYILEQALKVQDSIVICPPTPAQILLEKCLTVSNWVEEKSEAVKMRGELCKKAITMANGLEWREVQGGFFSLVKTPDHIDSYALADYLIDKYRIATIPGDAFGLAGKHHLRFSFGCLDDDDLQPAMEALARVNLSNFPL